MWSGLFCLLVEEGVLFFKEALNDDLSTQICILLLLICHLTLDHDFSADTKCTGSLLFLMSCAARSWEELEFQQDGAFSVLAQHINSAGSNSQKSVSVGVELKVFDDGFQECLGTFCIFSH